MLEKIRLLIQVKNNTNDSTVFVYIGLDVIERFVSNFVNISGVTKMCQADPQFNDYLNEYLIENNISVAIRNPRNKVLFSILQKAYLVYTINQMSQQPNNVNIIPIASDNTQEEERPNAKRIIITQQQQHNNDNENMINV